MEKSKNYGIPTLLVIGGLILSLLISILLHGMVMAPFEDPFTIEGLSEVFEDQADSRILDTFQQGDSALTLVKKADGNVFLLQFHKNLLLNRDQLLDVLHIKPEDTGFLWEIQSVLCSYVIDVRDHQEIVMMSREIGGLQIRNFFLNYGLNTLIIMGLGYAIYRTGRNFRRKKK